MSTDIFGATTGEEIVELSKRHTLFDWSAQARASIRFPWPLRG
jgi:hypothetical protein